MKKLYILLIAVVMITVLAVSANAAFGIVVEAEKIDKAPNLEEIDESWGDPVATNITSASENTYLWKYWNEWADTAQYEHEGTGPNGRTTCEPEDLPIDIYIRWDSKNLYFGIVAMDDAICGSENTHRGDGVKLWIQPIAAVADPTEGVNDNGDNKTFAEVGDGHPYSNNLYIWTLAFDDWSTDTEDAASDLMEIPVINADFSDRWQGIIAVPWTNLGIKKGEAVDGMELAIAFMRISSTGALDEGYSGGLCWGKFMKDTVVWGKTTNDTLNTVVLRDPAVVRDTETEVPATEAPATEAPATEAPATEAPATEAPATEAPATEAPATEAPATEAPATEALNTDPPVTEPVATVTPDTELPDTEEPAIGAPTTETAAPNTEPDDEKETVLATEAPTTEAPATEEVITEAPATEAPATETPKVEKPAEKNNTGLIIGIVAAVVVVGAVLGIVLGEKKK